VKIIKSNSYSRREKLPGNTETTVTFSCPVLNHLLPLLNDIKEQVGVKNSTSTYWDDVELCTQLHISKKTSRKYRNMGLEYVQIGKKIFYTPVMVEEFFSRHTQKAF